jgi:hypothetical protein
MASRTKRRETRARTKNFTDGDHEIKDNHAWAYKEMKSEKRRDLCAASEKKKRAVDSVRKS